MKTYRFGQYEITRICDGVLEIPAGSIIHTGSNDSRRGVHGRTPSAAILVDVNCYLLRGPDRLLMIDAGGGPDFAAGFGHVRTQLQIMGIRPEDISGIMLSHIHGDHALGLFDGDSPYFPNAEILVPEADLAFFTDPSVFERTPVARRNGFFLAEKLCRVYAARISPCPEGSVFNGIMAKIMPGHTPGHTGYLIDAAPNPLLIFGDTIHLPDLQVEETQIGLAYDMDPSLAADTRRIVLQDAAANGLIVAGGHLGFSRIEASGTGYRLTDYVQDHAGYNAGL